MNRVMTVVLIAGGLMLMNSPEAAAHKQVRNVYQPPAHYQSYGRAYERRPNHMPRWLKRNKSFHKWYGHTPLRHNRRLDWDALFDIYRWERSWSSAYRRSDKYRRSDNYWDDYYAYRYGERHHDRDRDRRNKRRHSY